MRENGSPSSVGVYQDMTTAAIPPARSAAQTPPPLPPPHPPPNKTNPPAPPPRGQKPPISGECWKTQAEPLRGRRKMAQPANYQPPVLIAERIKLERVMGIEPTSSAWEADALPLCYTRFSKKRMTGS